MVGTEYDDNGNITADETHAYGYTDANRLATATSAASTPYDYDYDGAGRRVRKSNTQSTYLFYAPSGRILTELRINNEVYGGAAYGQDYVYLPDAPMARLDWSVLPNPDYFPCTPTKGGQLCPPPRISMADLMYYHTDHLGTPLAMTNKSGYLAWKAEYSPFGELFSNDIAEVENNLRFPGQYFDTETGLHQNWFRDYDPKSGRYVEADAIGLAGGVNPYRYALGNPVFFRDANGLAAETFLDAASIGWSIYDFWREPSWANAGYLGWDVAATAIPFVPGSYIRRGAKPARSASACAGDAARGAPAAERLVIGRGADLAKPGALQAGERALQWPSKLPDVAAEWKLNSGFLRQEMQRGLPIRDISPGNTGGMFLNAERNLLESRGWVFDAGTNFWLPP